MSRRVGQPFHAGRIYRLLSTIFGFALLLGGLYVTLFAETQAALRILGGIAFALIGGNMVWSACKAKESWLSRIGPLP